MHSTYKLKKTWADLPRRTVTHGVTPDHTLLQTEIGTQHAPWCPYGHTCTLTHARTHAHSQLTQQSELLAGVLLLREGTLLVLVGAAPSGG